MSGRARSRSPVILLGTRADVAPTQTEADLDLAYLVQLTASLREDPRRATLGEFLTIYRQLIALRSEMIALQGRVSILERFVQGNAMPRTPELPYGPMPAPRTPRPEGPP